MRRDDALIATTQPARPTDLQPARSRALLPALLRGVFFRGLLGSAVGWGFGVGGAADPPASGEAAKTAYAAAAALQNRENWELAADEWQALIKAYPKDPLAAKGRYYLAICQLKAGQWPEASRTLAAVIASDADPATIALARWELAQGTFRAAQAAPAAPAYAAAAAELERFLAASPAAPQAAEAAYLQGEALWQAGRRGEAIAVWQAFVRDRPKAERLPEVLYALGVGQAETGAPDAAAATFARFAKEFPSHALAADVVLWRADVALKAGRRDEARPLLEQALAGGGTAGLRIAHRLAALELEAKRPEQALAAATKALAAAKTLATADRQTVTALELDRADALWELPDRRTDATAAYAAIAESDPAAPAAATALAMLALGQLQAGKPDAALARAEAFLARHAATAPADTVLDVKGIRAEALLALGRGGDAAAAFHELGGTRQSPRRAVWQLREAAALAAERKWPEVHGLLGELVSARPAGAAGSPPALAADQRAEALLLDATALVELKQPRPALALLAELARSQPQWPRRAEALLLEVRALKDAGDAPAALAAAERLVKDHPSAPGGDVAWYRLGQLRQDAGRWDDAIAAFTRARDLQPDGGRAPWSLLATGWCHEGAGRLPAAIRSWTECIDRYPDSTAATAALLARSDVRQRSGDFAGGRADAERILKAAAATAGRLDAAAVGEARFLAGLCLVGEKNYAAAEQAFGQLLAEQPAFATADRVLFELGVTQALAGRPAAAAATFTEFGKRFPQSALAADAWMELGEIRFGDRGWDGAAEAYEAALKAAGSTADRAALVEQARHKLAWTCVMRRDHARAVEVFTQQLEAAPRGPLAADAQAMLGESLLALDRPAEAAAAFARAVADADRLSSDDMRAAAFIRAAEAAARERKWADSLALAERFLAAHATAPRAPEARYAAAWARQNLGRLDEALAGYRAIAEAGRTELAARARLMEGEVLFEQGQHKEAIKAFFKAAYGFGERDAPAAYHPWQAQATFEAARCFEVLRQPDQARRLYAELLDRYPASETVAAARKRLAALGPAPP